jgi:hypothetical protein
LPSRTLTRSSLMAAVGSICRNCCTTATNSVGRRASSSCPHRDAPSLSLGEPVHGNGGYLQASSADARRTRRERRLDLVTLAEAQRRVRRQHLASRSRTRTPCGSSPNLRPSAHTCHSTAVAEALAAFFGTDNVPFSLDSRVTGTSREYQRFHEVVRGRQSSARPCRLPFPQLRPGGLEPRAEGWRLRPRATSSVASSSARAGAAGEITADARHPSATAYTRQVPGTPLSSCSP